MACDWSSLILACRCGVGAVLQHRLCEAAISRRTHGEDVPPPTLFLCDHNPSDDPATPWRTGLWLNSVDWPH